MFQYHFTSTSSNGSSTKKVDENTVYRIGSISKIMTVLALLLRENKVHFDDPITKYVPELAQFTARQEAEAMGEPDDVAVPQWSQITVGALASQLADIGRSSDSGDLSSSGALAKNLGLPELNSSDILSCGRDIRQPPCSEQEFLEHLIERHPVYAPFTAPVYSNAAFEILGLVIENVVNEPYEVVLSKTILKPLGLSRTSVKKPRDSWGVIPVGESYWGYELGAEVAAGAVYSSTKDLSNFARSIMKSLLLKPAQTREWLKPRTHTASLGHSVGAPWEISRTKGLTQDNRVIDLYTKSGSLGLYNSMLVLIPDYDVALTVLTAGPLSPADTLAGRIIRVFLPVIEQVGKRQTAALYAGSYGSESSNSSITLTVNGGPGIYVSAWINNGVDFFKAYKKVSLITTGNVEIRLYPTGLKAATPNNGSEVSFRATVRILPPTSNNSTVTSGRGQKFISRGCQNWASLDLFMYKLRGLDEFVFHLDGADQVTGVEPRAFRTLLKKQS